MDATPPTAEQQKYAQIWLDYFKQGDDLHRCMEQLPTPKAALLAHAARMDAVAVHLRSVAEVIGDAPVVLDADTHHIGIRGPAAIIDKLVADKLAQVDPPVADEDDGYEDEE